MKLRLRRTSTWYRWFAWYPVLDRTTMTWCWLCWVARMGVLTGDLPFVRCHAYMENPNLADD